MIVQPRHQLSAHHTLGLESSVLCVDVSLQRSVTLELFVTFSTFSRVSGDKVDNLVVEESFMFLERRLCGEWNITGDTLELC